MDKLAKHIHDARRPLNNISMQAELIKMLIVSGEHAEQIEQAAGKIVEHCQQCSTLLQKIGDSYITNDSPNKVNDATHK